MELSAGTAAGVSAPEWKAMSEETFFFYWGCVSTAKEENSAGSMMAADNQKVVWIFFFFFFFCFLPSEGFLAAASLSVLGSKRKFWDLRESAGCLIFARLH